MSYSRTLITWTSFIQLKIKSYVRLTQKGQGQKLLGLICSDQYMPESTLDWAEYYVYNYNIISSYGGIKNPFCEDTLPPPPHPQPRNTRENKYN